MGYANFNGFYFDKSFVQFFVRYSAISVLNKA